MTITGRVMGLPRWRAPVHDYGSEAAPENVYSMKSAPEAGGASWRWLLLEFSFDRHDADQAEGFVYGGAVVAAFSTTFFRRRSTNSGDGILTFQISFNRARARNTMAERSNCLQFIPW